MNNKLLLVCASVAMILAVGVGCKKDPSKTASHETLKEQISEHEAKCAKDLFYHKTTGMCLTKDRYDKIIAKENEVWCGRENWRESWNDGWGTPDNCLLKNGVLSDADEVDERINQASSDTSIEVIGGTLIKNGEPVCPTDHGDSKQPANINGFKCNSGIGFMCYTAKECVCGGQTIKGMNEDNHAPYGGEKCFNDKIEYNTDKIEYNTKNDAPIAPDGFVYEDSRLKCIEENCTYKGQNISKGMVIVEESPLKLVCKNETSCTWNGLTIRYSSGVDVEKGFVTCDGAPSPGDHFICNDYRWTCDADVCTDKDGTRISKGMKLKYISDKGNTYKCLNDVCRCGELEINEDIECIKNRRYCNDIEDPGDGFVCNRDDAYSSLLWKCDKSECKLADGSIVQKGYDLNGYCHLESCLCGTEPLEKLHTCKNGQQHSFCGKKPGDDFVCRKYALFNGEIYPDRSDYIYEDSYYRYQWVCTNDTCNANGMTISKGFAIIDDKATLCLNPHGCLFNNKKIGYGDRCNARFCMAFPKDQGEVDCAMDGCQDEDPHGWYSEIFYKHEQDACLEDSCPCGNGTCGKFSYCEDGMCVCDGEKFAAEHGGEICAPIEETNKHDDGWYMTYWDTLSSADETDLEITTTAEDMTTCYNDPYFDPPMPGDNFICNRNRWMCDADVCTDKEGIKLSKGMTLFKISDKGYEYDCLNDVCRCGDLELYENEKCIQNRRYCDDIESPGDNFICKYYYGDSRWTCDADVCTDKEGTKLSKGMTLFKISDKGYEYKCLNDVCSNDK